MGSEVIVLIAVVLLAGGLIIAAGRRPTPQAGFDVCRVTADGLTIQIDGSDLLIDWSSVFEVAVLTRRELGRTWFGFELLSEVRSPLRIDGSSGLGEQFLAEVHHLPRFDHQQLKAALTGREARAVCFSR